jgi:hypothetical protein
MGTLPVILSASLECLLPFSEESIYSSIQDGVSNLNHSDQASERLLPFRGIKAFTAI